MSTLSQIRCRNHADREAVARCKSCEHYFCRECVVEHEQRMICQHCLATLTGGGTVKRRRLAGMGGWLVAACGLLLAWGVFALWGRLLLSIDDTFHALHLP